MRLKVASELFESKNKMLGYVAMMDYYFHQICVKAEVEALLPMEVEYLGTTMKIEEASMAVVLGQGEEDEDKIHIFPKEQSYISAIIQAVMMVHPEFKVELVCDSDDEPSVDDNEKKDQSQTFGSKETNDKSDEDSEEVEQEKIFHIKLTMMPVNKTCRDTYHTMIGQLFDNTKLQLDTEKAKLVAKMTKLTVTDSEADREEVKKTIDAQYDENLKQAQETRDEKDQEVDRGYERYLKKHGDDEASADSSSKTGIEPESQSTSQPADAENASSEDDANDPNAMIAGVGQSLKL